MRCLFDVVKKIWNDPVGSAVIASIIYSVLTSICAWIKSLFFNGKTFSANLRETIEFPVFWGIGILLLAILAFKYFKIKRGFKYDEVSYKQDKELVEQIVTKDLPQSLINDCFRIYDFGEPFFMDKLKPLMNFEWTKRNSQYEFNNPILEKIKDNLLSSITSFKDYILANTTENEYGRLIISDVIRRDDNRFLTYKKKIHRLADDICKYYDELMRTMRAQRMAK